MSQPFCSGPVCAWLGLPLVGASAQQGAAYAAAVAASQVGGVGGILAAAVAGTATAAFLAQRAPFFLGYEEKGFLLDHNLNWSPLMSDRGGQIVPTDYQFQGKDALIGATVTVWSEPVLQRLEAMPSTSPGFRGADLVGDLGTLAMTEGAAPWLYLVFPYGIQGNGHPAMVAGGMEPGRRYLCAVPRKVRRQTGTGPNSAFVAFHCIRGFNPATGAQVLFDNFLVGATGLPT